MLSRDDYRAIKQMSKDSMSRWLDLEQNRIYNIVRKKFETDYKIELDNAIHNLITSIIYTLHFNEDVHLSHDEMASFMDDLFVTVDYFRTGEYKPQDYIDQLEKEGVHIVDFDYCRIYRELEEKYKKQYIPYKERNEKAIKQLEDFMANNPNPSCNIGDMELLGHILKGDL